LCVNDDDQMFLEKAFYTNIVNDIKSLLNILLLSIISALQKIQSRQFSALEG